MTMKNDSIYQKYVLKILWKRGEIAPKEQFLLFSTILCNLILDFYIKTRTRFSLPDKRLFEITEVETTRVDCICLTKRPVFQYRSPMVQIWLKYWRDKEKRVSIDALLLVHIPSLKGITRNAFSEKKRMSCPIPIPPSWIPTGAFATCTYHYTSIAFTKASCTLSYLFLLMLIK